MHGSFIAFLFKSNLLLFLITFRQIRLNYLLSLPLLLLTLKLLITILFYGKSSLYRKTTVQQQKIASCSPAQCRKQCGIFFLISASLTGCYCGCNCVVFSIMIQGSCRVHKTTNKSLPSERSRSPLGPCICS